MVLLLRPGDRREERLGGPGVVPGQLACGSAWGRGKPGPGARGGSGHQLMQAEALLVPGACCRVPSLEALPSPARASLDRTVTAG